MEYPTPSSSRTTAIMRGNTRCDTRPETQLRSLLQRHGLRFRKDLLLRVAETRVRPDVVFTRQKIAVFVDGCFWHRCPIHGHLPRHNRPYWSQKLARNCARDRRDSDILRQHGWLPMRVWEHEDLEPVARLIAALVRSPDMRSSAAVPSPMQCAGAVIQGPHPAQEV